MALDSKDSDIEQLRSQLQSIHIGLDNSSICGPGEVETDDGFPGKICPSLLGRERDAFQLMTLYFGKFQLKMSSLHPSVTRILIHWHQATFEYQKKVMVLVQIQICCTVLFQNKQLCGFFLKNLFFINPFLHFPLPLFLLGAQFVSLSPTLQNLCLLPTNALPPLSVLLLNLPALVCFSILTLTLRKKQCPLHKPLQNLTIQVTFQNMCSDEVLLPIFRY